LVIFQVFQTEHSGRHFKGFNKYVKVSITIF
jgi:hypothetical protein